MSPVIMNRGSARNGLTKPNVDRRRSGPAVLLTVHFENPPRTGPHALNIDAMLHHLETGVLAAAVTHCVRVS